MDAKIESFMDSVILVLEKPACAALWEIGEIMSALQCRHFTIIFQESLKNWTGSNICVIFCKNATMRLFRGNYKYCFLFLHNPWRGSASLQSPLITSCCESLAEQCVSWLHQMDLICVAVHSHDRQQMECSLRQHFAAWSWCLMNYGDK